MDMLKLLGRNILGGPFHNHLTSGLMYQGKHFSLLPLADNVNVIHYRIRTL